MPGRMSPPRRASSSRHPFRLRVLEAGARAVLVRDALRGRAVRPAVLALGAPVREHLVEGGLVAEVDAFLEAVEARERPLHGVGEKKSLASALARHLLRVLPGPAGVLHNSFGLHGIAAWLVKIAKQAAPVARSCYQQQRKLHREVFPQPGPLRPGQHWTALARDPAPPPPGADRGFHRVKRTTPASNSGNRASARSIGSGEARTSRACSLAASTTADQVQPVPRTSARPRRTLRLERLVWLTSPWRERIWSLREPNSLCSRRCSLAASIASA